MSTSAPVVDPLSNLYVLYHTTNRNPHPVQTFFRHNGDLPSAIRIGREYCDVTESRAIWVRPFLTNIDEEIKKRRDAENL